MRTFWERVKAWRSRGSNGGRDAEADGSAARDADDRGRHERYQARVSRPTTQLAIQVGLWAAVGVGAVSGLVSLVVNRPGPAEVVQATSSADSSTEVPAPVTGVAEQAVWAWLTTTDEELLATLYLEPPAQPPTPEEGRAFEIGQPTAVAGGRWEDGYWLVTVAVEVHQCVPPDEPGAVDQPEDTDREGASAGAEATERMVLVDCSGAAGEGSDEPAEDGSDEPADDGGDATAEDAGGESQQQVPQVSTWFVEVGVVGQLDHQVRALSTPAVVAPPADVSSDWRSLGRDAEAPEVEDEPTVETVEGFLQAWLAGGGDMARYLAPDVEASRIDPAPFAELELEEIAYEELEPGLVRAAAHVLATTSGDVEVVTAYELELSFRDDRWEVVAYWGAPSLAGRPGDPVEDE